jgi:RNA-directed DNA polymerase
MVATREILTALTSLEVSMSDEPKRRERQTAMGKSDRCIVPAKPGNAGGGKAATLSPQSRKATAAPSGREPLQTRLDRITERARRHRQEVFTNLYHHLDEDLLTYCFWQLNRDAAPGVDSITVEDYKQNLEENLRDLVGRLKRRSYRPLPSLRREIPKGDGKTRPLGLPSLEDKLVQRALATLLERVYEEDFYEFSFGFRPRKSCHDALKELSRAISTKQVEWICDADIKGFFDNVDFSWLERMIAHRVNDPQVLWLIRRFLRAGVLVEGKRLDTEKGVPQGGSISPLLANVYLHYVLDDWFARVVKKHLRGEAYLVRYADDFVVCFQYEDDARRFHKALQQRLAKFKLELSTEKTRIINFGRNAKRDAMRRGETKTPVFDFLGFTHYCGTSRKGRFKLKWRTAKKRFRAKLAAIRDWLRANLTLPLEELWTTLNQKLVGHYQYFGVSDNWPWLAQFRVGVLKLAFQWLNRRSQRRSFTWPEFYQYVDRFRLANPRRLVNLNSGFL